VNKEFILFHGIYEKQSRRNNQNLVKEHSWFLYHNNATTHTVLSIQNCLVEAGTSTAATNLFSRNFAVPEIENKFTRTFIVNSGSNAEINARAGKTNLFKPHME